MAQKPVEIIYDVAPTVARFHASNAFVRCLRGPFGSGKSVGCTMEILKRASEAPHSPDGYRRSRWAIIRNSYRELKDTTLKTWADWIPRDIWHWRESDMTGEIRAGDIRAEVLFRSLDTPSDVGKLLSLELTGAWTNEAKELPFAVISPLLGRLGRYPSRTLRNVPAWSGLIMDTNSPDDDHWIYKQFEEIQPKDWEMYAQPSGVSLEAENIANLPPNYYQRMIESNLGNEDWIKVFVHGEYGFVQEGKPVYPEYTDSTHCVPADTIKPLPHAPLLVGCDWGLTPAASISDIDPMDGQRRVIDELVSDNLGVQFFGEQLAELLRTRYPGRAVTGWGDPSGPRGHDERTPFDILLSQGVPIEKAPTNDPMKRREAVANRLRGLTMMGRPKLVISDKCRRLRKAMAGGYCYKRINAGQGDRFKDVPDKNNPHSHIADADQYAEVGEFGHYAMLDTAIMAGDGGNYTRPRTTSRFN